MNRKNRTAVVRRYLAIVSREVAPAMRLAAVCAVVCGIAILITLIYVKQHDDSLVGGAPFFLFTAYIILGIGIGLAAFSYLSERETDVFYKLLPASPFFTAVLKTVVTLVFCSAFIAVTVYAVYEISEFIIPTLGYGYINGMSHTIKGGAYALMELKGTLLAFCYGFSIGAFCATVFSRTVVAVIHTVPFLAFKFVCGLPTTEWFRYLNRNGICRHRGLSFSALFSPEFALIGAGINRGDDVRLEWFEGPIMINGAIILALALLLVALRQGEHSGRVFADRAFYPVYALPISFGAATVLEYVLGTFKDKISGSGWAVRYVTVSAVLFLIIGFLSERNIKKWKRVVIVFLIAFAWNAVMIRFPNEMGKMITSILK